MSNTTEILEIKYLLNIVRAVALASPTKMFIKSSFLFPLMKKKQKI